MHEASLYDDNVFLTLTFNDKYLDKNLTLNKEDFQNFMKRLRKRFVPIMPEEVAKLSKHHPEKIAWNFKHQIRYYHCGEYGAKYGRPHHHACIFNLKLNDLEPFKRGLYTSQTIQKLWSDPKTGESLGFHSVGEVNYDTAAYVARYILKKINGEAAEAHYEGRQPEYITMSRRPGIGANWYELYGKDIHEKDEVAFKKNGRIIKVKPPKYYDKRLEAVDPGRYEEIKEERREYRLKHPQTGQQRQVIKDKLDRQLLTMDRTLDAVM